MAGTFQCSVVTPEAPLLDESVRHVAIPAWDGSIGILVRRAPLLAKLGHGVLHLDLAQGGTRELFVSGGFAQMKGDTLSILTDQAMPMSEINRENAATALKQAHDMPHETSVQTQRRSRELERARAMTTVAARA